MNHIALAPIPFEQIGKPHRRASETDRDNAALALAGYVVAMLKFGPSEDWRDELLKRANKVRRSQGNGDVVFVRETAEKIRAAAEPEYSSAEYEKVEELIRAMVGEPL